MTQTIVQGPEDPLLVLDHQGGSGNPTFLIQQDETAAAYIWWDQVNQVFNMGPASVGGPSLSITSDGVVNIAQLRTNGLLAGPTTINGGIVIDSANITQLRTNGLLAGPTTINGGIVIDSANITQLRTNGLLAGPTTINGGMVVDSANIAQLTTNGLLAGPTTINGGMVVDNVNVSGTITAGNYLTSSSREIKENIIDLSNQEALEVLGRLSPVKFNLKADETKKIHIGFIAENVPHSVAGSDGKSINVMDIIAILTRVVKEQQKTIEALVAKSH